MMMFPAVILVANFIVVTGPDNQIIRLNSQDIVSMRAPRGADHFAAGTRCLIFTVDGKYVSVKEECEEVFHMMEGQ